MALIRCVMFDFGNVIGIFDTPCFREFIIKHRRNCTDPEELFSGSLHHLTRDYDAGRMDSHQYFQAIEEAFQLENVSMYEFFQTINRVIHIDTEMLAIIDRLRNRGVATVLITNMNPALIAYLRQNQPEILSRFDHLFISCEEKVAKPNEEAWIRPLDAMGLKVEECICVDDYIGNIETFCNMGGKGWYYNVTGKHYFPNGKLEEERQKLNNFLEMLWKRGILRPYFI